jgi:acyl transferase domain-containing protein
MTDPTPSLRTAFDRAVVTINKLRTRLAAVERASSEPIAIVGMGCRFPGGANDPAALWRLLEGGVDAIREVPRDRWDIDAVYDPDPRVRGKMCTRWGGFLDTIDRFDAELFAITPREAANLDPQQRLLLEVTWEALEHAGFDPGGFAGTATGVFVGFMTNEYLGMLHGGDLTRLDGFMGMGNTSSAVSGRLSYVLGLTGPSITVDSACSSSLVTLHLACQSLRAGECDMALAGGVGLMLTPAAYIELSRLGGLARDGRCKTFDASSDGVAWGEGCGMVVLKRLSVAQAHGDRVLAVIRGSAVNQDGRSNGIAAPNGPSQEALMRTALSGAGLSPGDIDYVEAHGTATRLGDPIELGALGAVHADRPADRPLLVGSLKTNFGHTQAAAGVAGLLKLVLSLQHEAIPASLHFTTPSPYIPWSELKLRVAAQAVPWRAGERPRRGGVSSFGVSGTNAHVIVEEAPAATAEDLAAARPAYLLPLSARSEEALDALVARYARHLADDPAASIADICYTAGVGRTHFAHRLAIVVTSRDQLIEDLGAIGRGEAPRTWVRGVAPPSRPQLAFVFSGQGPHRVALVRELFEREAVFRASLERCAAALDPELDRPLLSVIFDAAAAASPLDEIKYAQPALFAIAVSLVELWRSWGITPDVVVGHSQGEVAAAYVAGALSLGDAAKVICRRSKLIERATGGGMAVVGLSEDQARARIARHGDRLAIAAVNSATSIVLSGDPDALEAVLAELAADGTFARRLKAASAGHSRHMDAIREELVATLADLAPRAGTIPLVSTVTGERLTGTELGAEYWWRNARDTVRFGEVTSGLVADGIECFVEASPHPLLAATIASSAGGGGSAARVTAVGSLRQDEREGPAMLASLGALYVRGARVDWSAAPRGRRVALPTYPFARDRYWVEPRPEPSPSPQVRGELEALLDGPDAAPLARRFALLARLTPEEAVVAAKIAGALRDHRGRQDQIAPHLYEVAWRERPRRHAQPPASGRWLVVGSGAGIAEAIAAQLQARGAACAIAASGVDFDRVAAQRFRLDLQRPDHLARLLAELTAEGPLAGVVHVASLEGAVAAEPGPADVPPARGGLAGALALVQAVVSQAAPPPVFFVTRGANAVGAPGPISIAQAPLWGFARAFSLEHPEVGGALIDVPLPAEAGEIAALTAELLDREGEDHIAFRGGKRFVSRIARYAVPAHPDPWRARGTWLVTGGLGAIGQHLAHWLVERGAERLVLVGRRGLATPGARDAVAALEQRGARVHVVAADVASEAEVARILGIIDAEGPPLRGIVHAAGVPTAVPARALTAGELDEAVAAKLHGAWWLHRLTQDRGLDAFVCCSSGASVWGGFLQSAYAAANGFLDALVHERRRLGLAGLSVNWGGWAGTGMGAEPALAERYFERFGLYSLGAGIMLDALDALLAAGATQATVAKFDWPEFRAAYERQRPRSLVAEMAPPRPVEREAPASPAGLPEDAPGSPIEADLEGILRAVLKLKKIGVHDNWFQLGAHSLLLIEVLAKINALYGLKLHAASLLDSPTIARVAALIEAQLIEQASPAEVAQMIEDAAQLSPEEFAALLADEADEADDLSLLPRSGPRLPGGRGQP